MHDISRQQGFEIRTLKNDRVEIAVAPALGAKVISLKNLATGRQWMWHPGTSLRLFANRLGDDFAASTMTGWDECIPTIAPCRWKGRDLPDHGEVWSVPWQVDEDRWGQGVLKTSVKLAISPLSFERSIKLVGGEVRVNYALTNLGAASEDFLWAMHPLMPAGAGDRLDVPEEVRAMLGNSEWLDTLDASEFCPPYVKAYASGISQGHAAAINDVSGDRLEFSWDASENDKLGLWLTRGGWNGHHHLAIEPTNAAADSLAETGTKHGSIGGGASKNWSVRLRLSS